ncbi:site-specific integrase [Lentibacillus cibarius]|uniref:Site-specific integrase n=1 Tax=Lentibacillus cibarius TaxID=2583219 RepID=A0A5S3QMZ0_9BACI|nr:site-specific integrase [Lentibacillus cibarius]TMN23149.1 site-specific integrase [Lentibacillus cibarius]
MKFVQPIRDKEKIELMKQSFNNERDRFLFIMGINTALRVSDLLQLKVKDVKGTHLKVIESKTGKLKRQIISMTLREEINEYTKGMNEEDVLFPSRKGNNKPLSRVQAYRILNRVSEQVGLEEIGTHTLRKTFSYWYYKQTKDVVTVQQLLNHSSPAVTLRYIGVNQDEMDERLKDFSL